MSIQGLGQQYNVWQLSTASQSSAASKTDASAVFSKDDTNTDGVLSIDETPLSEDMFSNADTDADGSLTLQEMEEMLASAPPPPMGPPPGGSEGMDFSSLLDAEDSDASGTISSKETSLSQGIFSALDTNQDGEISAEEYAQAISGAGESSKNEPQTRNLNQTTAISAYQDALTSFVSEMSTGSNGGTIASFLETFV